MDSFALVFNMYLFIKLFLFCVLDAKWHLRAFLCVVDELHRVFLVLY